MAANGFPSLDVVVVGSGPGGATVTRELARAGARVLLVERGVDHRPRGIYGTYLGALLYAERRGLLFTEEGLNIIRPIMVGGATSMYCGCASPPPEWLASRYGVDLQADVAHFVDELGIAPLPEELLGAASTRLADAGRALGQDWRPQAKFVRPARSRRFDCGAKCMLGCRCGAKWSAAEFVDDAVEAGARLRTRARVRRVLVEGGRAVGVEGTSAGRLFRIRAGVVVLAAGGIGTPRILQASGFPAAGTGMAVDTTAMVYGTIDGEGIGREPPMTWSWENKTEGFMLSTLVDPWLFYPVINGLVSPRRILTWPRWRHLLGVMIKLKDEVSGRIAPGGRISKPLTASDAERLAHAEELAEEILLRAGARPGSIYRSGLRGTHPSGTVRIGEMVGTDLGAEIPGLFVCDASVFPEALGRPTVLTILGLARRLARHLRASIP